MSSLNDAWDQHLDQLNSKRYSRDMKVSIVRIEGPFEHSRTHIMHVHPYWQLALVFGKSFSVTIHDQVFTPEIGDVLLIPPQNWHHFDFSQGKQAWTIKFSLEGYDEQFRPGIIAHNSEVKLLEEWISSIIQYEEESTPERMLLMEHLIGALLDLHLKSSDFDHRSLALIQRIRSFVDGELVLGHAVTAGEVAQQLCLSPSYLKQTLKKHMGIPLKVYIDQRRFDTIREFLTHSELNATQIASRLGFADVFRLSRFFKRMSGLSPLAYRTRFTGR